jgi:hypothetical protein
MRRTLALGCGALYLVFGFMAGLAHVHESADHHQEYRGLHVDHGHLNDSGDHDHHHGHSREAASGHEEQIHARHADHHDGDAIHLNTTASLTLDSNARVMPAIVSASTVIDPPSSSSELDETFSRQPRYPPRKIPPRLRAPPA